MFKCISYDKLSNNRFDNFDNVINKINVSVKKRLKLSFCESL